MTTDNSKAERMADALLPSSPGARFELLVDLYAPRDEDGVRQPEHGIITREDALQLLGGPDATEE